METTSRGQAEKHPPPPTDGFWKEGGGGEQGGKVVMGGRALRKRAGGEDGLALGKQVTTVIGFFIFSVFSLFSCCFLYFVLFSCSHNGRPVVLGPGTGKHLWQCDDSGWCSST